jgi:hypothetical protein
MTLLRWMITGMACLAGASASAQEDRPALATSSDTYVALEVLGCAGSCPAYELYLFDDGRVAFRSNNRFTSHRGTVRKQASPENYTRLVDLMDRADALRPAPCENPEEGKQELLLISGFGSLLQKAGWSYGCTNQRDTADRLIKGFVEATGTWRLIKANPRYWRRGNLH